MGKINERIKTILRPAKLILGDFEIKSSNRKTTFETHGFDQRKVRTNRKQAKSIFITCWNCTFQWKVKMSVLKPECPDCGTVNVAKDRGIYYAETCS